MWENGSRKKGSSSNGDPNCAFRDIVAFLRVVRLQLQIGKAGELSGGTVLYCKGKVGHKGLEELHGSFLREKDTEEAPCSTRFRGKIFVHYGGGSYSTPDAYRYMYEYSHGVTGLET